MCGGGGAAGRRRCLRPLVLTPASARGHQVRRVRPTRLSHRRPGQRRHPAGPLGQPATRPSPTAPPRSCTWPHRSVSGATRRRAREVPPPHRADPIGRAGIRYPYRTHQTNHRHRAVIPPDCGQLSTKLSAASPEPCLGTPLRRFSVRPPLTSPSWLAAGARGGCAAGAPRSGGGRGEP